MNQRLEKLRTRSLSMISPAIMLLGPGIIVASTIEYRGLHIQAQDRHKGAYQTGTVQAANDMERMFHNVERAAESLAASISDGSLPSKNYESALKDMLGNNQLFYGGAIAFAPYTHLPDAG